MRRKTVSLLLVLALLCTLAPRLTLTASAAASGVCGDHLTWSFDAGSGVLTISGYGEMTDFNEYYYDEESYQSYPVVPWSGYAGQVLSVALPKGLTVIGGNAFFNFVNLKQITIPEGVTEIGFRAFKGCSSLQSVTIPKSVNLLSNEAFEGCSSLQSITIPQGVTYIWSDTFYGCSSLKSIAIPEGVTQIDSDAFYGCTSLADISIPDSLEFIGSNVFDGTAFFEDPNNWADQLLYLDRWLIKAKYGIVSANVRPGTVGIADSAFRGQYDLKSVTLPEGLETVGSFAFTNCSQLTGVHFPGSVKRVGGDPFSGSAFYHNTKNWTGPILYLDHWLIQAEKEVASVAIRPDTVGIAASAFNGCSNLTLPNNTLPDGLRYIGAMAFMACGSIRTIVLPESVCSIGSEAFDFNDHLENVVILNKNCEIFNGRYVFGIPGWQVITGYPGSTAEAYARKYGCPFQNVEALGFVDVEEAAYYSKPAQWALDENITTGTSPHIFNADKPCTRAQVVTFLWRANGSPEPEASSNPFKDVPAGQYYSKAVLWALEQGVTTGTSADTFSPDSACTRGQVVTFLWRARGKPVPESAENTFSDVKRSDYFCPAVDWAVDRGVTTGTSAGTFSPDSACSRGQIVTFLYRDLA